MSCQRAGRRIRAGKQIIGTVGVIHWGFTWGTQIGAGRDGTCENPHVYSKCTDNEANMKNLKYLDFIQICLRFIPCLLKLGSIGEELPERLSMELGCVHCDRRD